MDEYWMRCILAENLSDISEDPRPDTELKLYSEALEKVLN